MNLESNNSQSLKKTHWALRNHKSTATTTSIEQTCTRISDNITASHSTDTTSSKSLRQQANDHKCVYICVFVVYAWICRYIFSGDKHGKNIFYNVLMFFFVIYSTKIVIYFYIRIYLIWVRIIIKMSCFNIVVMAYNGSDS